VECELQFPHFYSLHTLFPNSLGLPMKLVIASDHAGFPLKEDVRAYLATKGHEVVDLGVHSTEPSDYPDSAEAVGDAINAGVAKRGILICGSGVGVCVAANKIPGIRAGMCHDHYSAHQGVEHDDMNVSSSERASSAPKPPTTSPTPSSPPTSSPPSRASFAASTKSWPSKPNIPKPRRDSPPNFESGNSLPMNFLITRFANLLFRAFTPLILKPSSQELFPS
jgi:RpiB/LacA/LacB family sugar-phosphate isomerase